MDVTLFSVRFVFQYQGDDKGDAKGDNHPDNVCLLYTSQAAGIGESSKSEAADIAAKKLNPFQRIARLLSNIFVPIIPCLLYTSRCV